MRAGTKMSVLSQTRSNSARDSQEHKGPEARGCDRRSAPVLVPICNELTAHFTREPIQAGSLSIAQGYEYICGSLSRQRPPEPIRTYHCDIWTPNTLMIARAPFCPAYTFRLSVCAKGTTEVQEATTKVRSITNTTI